MSDVVAEAKAALEGVTEGPWATERSKYVSGWYVFRADDGRNVLHAVESEGIAPPDFQFIAATRTLVPALVAEIERLRAGYREAANGLAYWAGFLPEKWQNEVWSKAREHTDRLAAAEDEK